MPVKLRLARHGKKGHAYYHIVVADSRAPRDGKFIEKIGTYNPGTNPATIDLDNQKALAWLKKGAQPTDTMRAILSYKGILYRAHLDKGVTKGALASEKADELFNEWTMKKGIKIDEKKKRVATEHEKVMQSRLEAETKKRGLIEEKVKKKTSQLAAEEEKAAEASAETATAEATPETPSETPAEPAAEAPAENPPAEGESNN